MQCGYCSSVVPFNKEFLKYDHACKRVSGDRPVLLENAFLFVDTSLLFLVIRGSPEHIIRSPDSLTNLAHLLAPNTSTKVVLWLSPRFKIQTCSPDLIAIFDYLIIHLLCNEQLQSVELTSDEEAVRSFPYTSILK